MLIITFIVTAFILTITFGFLWLFRFEKRRPGNWFQLYRKIGWGCLCVGMGLYLASAFAFASKVAWFHAISQQMFWAAIGFCGLFALAMIAYVLGALIELIWPSN